MRNVVHGSGIASGDFTPGFGPSFSALEQKCPRAYRSGDAFFFERKNEFSRFFGLLPSCALFYMRIYKRSPPQIARQKERRKIELRNDLPYKPEKTHFA